MIRVFDIKCKNCGTMNKIPKIKIDNSLIICSKCKNEYKLPIKLNEYK